MKRPLDKDGREMRRPLGFNNRDLVPDESTTGAVSGTQHGAPQPRKNHGPWTPNRMDPVADSNGQA